MSIPETMKVAMYYRNNDVRCEEMPVPEIGPGELLVKVMASGICGSDVLEWYRIKKAPRVLGHEISGEIVAVGDQVDTYKPGQRVFVSHHIPCNTCHYCLNGYHTACETLHSTNFDPGGFAQYLRVPALNVDRGVFPLPNNMSWDEGAFVEPLACVVRAQRLVNLKPGQCLAVLGSGISGLLHIQLAKALGAGRIIATDINPRRLETAKKCGADTVINAREDVPALIKKANGGRPADQVFVCTGAKPAFVQALNSVDRGGTILCFATTEPGVDLEVPLNEFWRNEIKLMPSYGNAPYDAVVAIELISNRRVPVTDLITHRLPIDRAGEGFQMVASAQDCIKVIVEPHG